MRQSVTRHSQRVNVRQRRIRLALLLVLLSALCALFIAYTNWRVDTDIKASAASQKVAFAQLDKQVAETKRLQVEAAKKAEAAAKVKADADEAARKAAAAAQPSGTASTARTVACDVSNPYPITVIVNKKHCFNPASWAPNDLTSVDGYLLRAEAASHMQAMMSDATTAGVGFTMSSAYRSYSDQVVTYNYWISANGSQAAADTVSARPGYSDHQTGLTADLKAGSCVLECFGTTPQYQWLSAHGAEYGFIRRYPEGLTTITGYSPEAWHWRYVGVSVAQDMKAKGIETMEEYFGITGGDYAN